MDLTITLSKGAIVLRAKDDTYLSVRSYLVGHEANAKSKYEMQADERATHERKLLQSIGSAVSSLKSHLNRWKISDTLNDDSDAFDLTFSVSERVNPAKNKDIGRLVEEYIYKSVVADWWKVNYPDSAQSYLSDMAFSLNELESFLILNFPEVAIKHQCVFVDGFCHLLIYKDSLLNDIHAEMLKMSHERTNEQGLQDINLQTSELYGEGIILKYIHLYISRVAERISVYLQSVDEASENDTEPVYTFKLLFPDTWNKQLSFQFGHEVHSYIVNSCVNEWTKSYLPELSRVYQMEAELAYRNIKHIVTSRISGAIYKPLQPF